MNFEVSVLTALGEFDAVLQFFFEIFVEPKVVKTSLVIEEKGWPRSTTGDDPRNTFRVGMSGLYAIG